METLERILEDKGHELQVIGPDALVIDAVGCMCRAHVGALLVMREQTLVGIFSERDLMTRVTLARRDPAVTRVGEVMTSYVFCLRSDASPHEAMNVMTTRRVRHLPVVAGHRVMGVISIGDLVRWTIRDREHEIEQLHDYVTGRYPG
jgi:CBS domain-containing protein